VFRIARFLPATPSRAASLEILSCRQSTLRSLARSSFAFRRISDRQEEEEEDSSRNLGFLKFTRSRSRRLNEARARPGARDPPFIRQIAPAYFYEIQASFINQYRALDK